MRSHRRRRAGFSLIEAVVVSALVAVFAVFLAGTIVTSTTLNRETFVENEVVDLAGRVADDLASALSGAGRFTDAWDLSTMGDQLEFQDIRFDATGNKIFGARTTAAGFSDGGVRRLVFFAERTFNETVFNLDLNGDGDRTDTAVVVGRLELRTHLGTGLFSTTEQAGLRRIFGGGRIYFCQTPSNQPIFGRTPYTGRVGANYYEFASRAGQIVRTEDDTSEAVTGTAGSDPCDVNGVVAGSGGEEAFGAGRTPTTYYPRPTNTMTFGGAVVAKIQTSASTPPGPGPLDDFTDPVTWVAQADTAVRLNLRVIYNPIPSAGRGIAQLHAMSLVRTVTLQ